MTSTLVRPQPVRRASPHPPTPPPPWHQRLSARWWSRITTIITVGVFVAATVTALVLALHAPSVSPVSPAAAGTGTPATTGVLDVVGNLFGGTDTGRGGTGRDGRR